MFRAPWAGGSPTGAPAAPAPRGSRGFQWRFWGKVAFTSLRAPPLLDGVRLVRVPPDADHDRERDEQDQRHDQDDEQQPQAERGPH